MATNTQNKMNFWAWFRHGSGGKPGYQRLFDRSQFIHLAIGLLIAVLVHKSLDIASATVLLPLAGVLVGLSFAWGGSAQALLQADEIYKVSKHVQGGFRDYVFTYQTAILALLVTFTIWGLAGLGLFELLLINHHPDLYKFAKIIIYSATSLCIREAWGVVLFAQAMLLMRADMKQASRKRTAKRRQKDQSSSTQEQRRPVEKGDRSRDTHRK